MHFIDIVAAVAVAAFVGIGIKRGFIGEVFRLAAVLLGFAAALFLYGTVYRKLAFVAMPPTAKTALSFLLVYVAVALSVLAAGWLVRKIVHLTLLGWLDRLLGGLVGLAKALILVWILVLCVAVFPISRIHTSVSESFTFKVITAVPFRLKAPSLDSPLPSLRSIVDIDKPIGKLRTARERLDDFKDKVDSAKAHADSLRTPSGHGGTQ